MVTKILTKTITTSLQSVLKDIVCTNQSGEMIGYSTYGKRCSAIDNAYMYIIQKKQTPVNIDSEQFLTE